MMKKTNLKKYSIDDWEQEFEDIYGNVDQKRSPSDMWLLLLEDASKVAEALRKEAYFDALNALAHTFNWTCAFVSRCRKDNNLGIIIENSLSDIIWYKYPNVCSLCGEHRCICPVRRQELEDLTKEEKNKKTMEVEKYILNIARNRTEDKPTTLDGFTDMLSWIYKGPHYQLTIEAIAFHFMEEIGEVSAAIRNLRESSQKLPPKKFENNQSNLTHELEMELADVISWTMSLIHKLDYLLGAGAKYLKGPPPKNGDKKIPQTVNLKLSEVVWTAFQTPDGHTLYCPSCSNRPCKCKPVPL